MDIIVREACGDDARAMLEYLKVVGGESDNLVMGGSGIGDDEEKERRFLTAKQQSVNSVQLLALEGNRIIGCISVEASSREKIRHRGEIGVSVLKAYWGQGVGTHLFEVMLAWAGRSETGLCKLELTVRADNESGLALYRRFGFEEEGRIRRLFCIGGVFFDGIVMGRLLD